MSVRIKQPSKSVANLEKSISLILSGLEEECVPRSRIELVWGFTDLFWRKMQIAEHRRKCRPGKRFVSSF